MASSEYIARLCWNSKGWRYPTGEAASTESDTYAARIGYGHEEWLFNFEWVLDGWKYGFLQPVNKSYSNMSGRRIGVRLYTISPSSDWFYVGHIPACEVLTEDQAGKARTEFRKKGWLKEMEAHVKRVSGKLEGLRYEEPQTLFNVRFRPSTATLYEDLVPVRANDGIRKHRRYTLVELTGIRKRIVSQWPTRAGTRDPKSTRKGRRRAIAGTNVDPVEAQLQNELFRLLEQRFGSAVVMEENFVDVKLRHMNVVHLFEVKADPRPRKAIREALGQLLEYAFTCKQAGQAVGSLIVAAPGQIDEMDRKYLEHLRNVRRLPVHYVCLRRGMKSLELPW